MKPSNKIVYVEWWDAHTVDLGGWADPSDLAIWKRGTLCRTVGFLMSRDRNAIKIFGSYNLDQKNQEMEQISGTFVIPAGMVKTVRILR